MDALSAITPHLPASLNGDPESILNSRQDDAYEQLEAVFMSMLIKEMRTSGMEEGLFAGDAADTFGGMFDSFMGDRLAEFGGIGIQRLIKEPATPIIDNPAAIHRQAKEAYQHATTDSTITGTTGGS